MKDYNWRTTMELFTYSFGVNSILKLQLTEEHAMRYNRFLQAFFDAQEKILEETGTRWDPRDPIYIDIEEGDKEVFNAVGRLFTAQLEFIDQTKTRIEIDDDFLVKN